MGWKHFERLVAQIHDVLDGSNYTVTHNVTLTEVSGATHQIDVLLTPKTAFSGPVLISCKSSESPVGIDHIREWADIVSHLGAAAGVIVSSTGFTSGAIAAAKDPTRRISLWIPRPLTANDFAPDEKSPDGYIREVNAQAVIREPRPHPDTFVLDVESVTGKHEGITLKFQFSAGSRDSFYLRDGQDNVVANLWDNYVEMATNLHASGIVRVEPAEPRFIVLDGHRFLFKSLSMYVEIVEHMVDINVDLAKMAFAYENAVTQVTKTVPLPPNILSISLD
jgi:hypothetical protein